ncbi:hypothetical protein CXT84_06885 [Akkermansia muciniphila]|jgi:hypothetical protein|uniref:hypothetical protein n=1 Tax=Akkermansia muciniphila TaxID=239935 RepID=UPI000C9C159A|nr:hypothetical protein [Akkermansia muciniphila]PND13124.1 hypothetical protein CXT84_06885 [Akkermansia muciniphila]
MPAHIGDVPKHGIDEPEKGIFVESIDFDGQQEIYEQKDNRGKKCGVLIIDEELSFSMSGAILTTGAASLKMGASLTLANEIPDIWNETPSATTVFLKGVKHNLKNTDAQKMDVSGTVYGFGAASDS